MGKTYIASSALITTIIGAGILGIPYVIMKSGFSIGLIALVLIAGIIILTQLYLGEIALRTKETHQLPGYAEKYLGKTGKKLMAFALVFGVYSALTAYIIGEGTSLSYIIFGSGNYSFALGIAFWILLSLISFFGITALKKAEPVNVIFILVMIISLCILLWNKINPANLAYINLENFYVPFGVILFAFLGFSAIPEVRRILGKEKHLEKRVIWVSYLFVLLVYIIFTIVVLGAKGFATPEISTIALGKPFILLGIITMFGASLALSVALEDAYKFDFKFSKIKAWLATILVPLAVFTILQVAKKASFVDVIGIGGVISGGLSGILILLMAKKAKIKGNRKPEYKIPYSSILAGILILVYVLGVVAEIINVLF